MAENTLFMNHSVSQEGISKATFNAAAAAAAVQILQGQKNQQKGGHVTFALSCRWLLIISQ